MKVVTKESPEHTPPDTFPTRCNFTQSFYFWKTSLQISGNNPTHHQEHIQLHLQHLALVNHYRHLPVLW